MYGLNFLLNIKRAYTLNLLFLSFILMLGIAYISPLYLAEPEKTGLDGSLLFGTYLLLLLNIYHKKPIDYFRPLNTFNKYLATALTMLIVFYSFILLNDIIKHRLLHPNNDSFRGKKIYTPMRVAVTHQKNNQHDNASFTFLDNEIERFATDITAKRSMNFEVGMSDDDYHRIS